MRHLKLAGLIGGAALALPVLPGASAATLTIDDFGGGPHLTFLVSTTPPEIDQGTFAYAGAVGGYRDVFVISDSLGIFNAGVAFGSGGYASFTGRGLGGVIWDGSNAAAPDANGDLVIDPTDFEYGLNLDLTGNCPEALLHLRAFADLPNAEVLVTLATSPTDYATYAIALTTVGSFDDYFASVFAPTTSVGAFDPTNVKSIAMTIDGRNLDNLDVQASLLGVVCVPESGTWMAVSGLGGVLGLTWARARRAAAAK